MVASGVPPDGSRFGPGGLLTADGPVAVLQVVHQQHRPGRTALNLLGHAPQQGGLGRVVRSHVVGQAGRQRKAVAAEQQSPPSSP